MPAERVIWTVPTEFAVEYPEGWAATCGDCLPIILRRAARMNGKPTAKVVTLISAAPCDVRKPHPAPAGPPRGYSCPRPLAGPCLDATCDHD